MGCVKLHILDEQYKRTELKVSYINKKLTPNFCAVKPRRATLIRFIDPDGRWPYVSIIHPEITKHGATEMARGTLNTGLFIAGIGQAVAGGIAAGLSENKYSVPEWSIPMQINENWEIEKKPSWANETLSWEDGKDIMKNTLFAIISFFPFSQASNGLQRVAENAVISSVVTTSIDMATSSSSPTTTDSPSTPSSSNNAEQQQPNDSNQKIEQMLETVKDKLKEWFVGPKYSQ